MACDGRVGAIIERVRFLFNQTGSSGPVPDDPNNAELVAILNLLLGELSGLDSFIMLGSFDAVSGVADYDLESNIPGFVGLKNLAYLSSTGQYTALKSVPNWRFMELARESVTRTGTPQIYWVEGDGKVKVWPAPGGDVTDGFQARYSYLPEDVTCIGESATFPWPPAFDSMAVYYVLYQLFTRDRHAPGASKFAADSFSKFQIERDKFLERRGNVTEISPQGFGNICSLDSAGGVQPSWAGVGGCAPCVEHKGTIRGEVFFEMISAGENPSGSQVALFFKTDGVLYKRSSSGVETPIEGGGGGGIPSDNVSPETGWEITPSAGSALTYSRGDHTHGSPENPVILHEQTWNHDDFTTKNHNHGTAGEEPVARVAAHAEIDGDIDFLVQTEPGAAPDDRMRMWFESDGILYAKGMGHPKTPVGGGGGGGTGTPSDSVVQELGWGQGYSAGSSEEYSRGDHTHGTPDNPVTAHESAYDHPAYDVHLSATAPHSGHELIANKGQPSGYAGLGGNALVPSDQLGTGTADATTVLYGDGVYREPPGSTGGEANTGVNVGGELGVFKQKAGVNLEFYSFEDTQFELNSDVISILKYVNTDHDHTNGAGQPVGELAADVLADGALDLTNIATPSNPVSGQAKIYSKADSQLYILDSNGNESRVGGKGATPSDSVVSDTSFGQAPAVGTSSEYSRGDHTHGTPNDPVLAHESTYDHPGYDTHVAAAAPHSGHEQTANKGQADGYASLGSDGKVPATQLPASSGGSAVDIMGGLIERVSDTEIKWAFDTSNEVMLFNETSGAWELVKLASEPPITNTGTSPSTAYDVYLCYDTPTSATLELRAWSDMNTPPARAVLDGRTVWGAGAGEKEKRFVARIGLYTAGIFTDENKYRLISNEFNKKNKNFMASPRYTSATSQVPGTSSWVKCNGTAFELLYMSDGKTPTIVTFSGSKAKSGMLCNISIGVDSSIAPHLDASMAMLGSANAAASSVLSVVLPEGFHQVFPVCIGQASGSEIYYYYASDGYFVRSVFAGTFIG